MHLLVFYASYENAWSELKIHIIIGDMESYLILRIGENETVSIILPELSLQNALFLI
jgi:hypothetical protein